MLAVIWTFILCETELWHCLLPMREKPLLSCVQNTKMQHVSVWKSSRAIEKKFLLGPFGFGENQYTFASPSI